MYPLFCVCNVKTNDIQKVAAPAGLRSTETFVLGINRVAGKKPESAYSRKILDQRTVRIVQEL